MTGMPDDNALMSLMAYSDPTGLRVMPAAPNWEAGSPTLDCEIEAREGVSAGRAEVGLRMNGPSLLAHIEQLFVSPDHRPPGFGRRFINEFGQRCARVGVDRLELFARDVGGYFWATVGFEFRAPNLDEREGSMFEPPPPELTDDSLPAAMRQAWFAADWYVINDVDDAVTALVRDCWVDASLRRKIPFSHSNSAAFTAWMRERSPRKVADIASFGRERAWMRDGQSMWLGGKAVTGGTDWWGAKYLVSRS